MEVRERGRPVSPTSNQHFSAYCSCKLDERSSLRYVGINSKEVHMIIMEILEARDGNLA